MSAYDQFIIQRIEFVDSEPRKNRRRFAPKLEALEALQLLDGASTAGLLNLSQTVPSAWIGSIEQHPSIPQEITADAWDEALLTASPHDLGAAAEEHANLAGAITSDRDGVLAGLSQLNRYLGRVWSRAGIASDQREDCTQAVLATLLQQMGRVHFDQTMERVGESSIPSVFPRDTVEGQIFSRALDLVKKRAVREKQFLTLEDHSDAAFRADSARNYRRDALHEAIDQALNPREASLIRATLEGYTPSEIAERWGVAAKTISNEKSRALQKLREALAAEVLA